MKIAGFLLAASVAAASVQPLASPTEHITVTAPRDVPAAVVDHFVQSFSAPTRTTGKIARWEDGICPVTVGLRPAASNFVTQRVRKIAGTVGVPVNDKGSCKPNIEIVFTTKPESLLSNIRKTQPNYLGYQDNKAELEKLAAVTHPIQAWYTTATKDLRGNTEVDGAKTAGMGVEITYDCIPPAIGECTMHVSSSHAVAVTGSRLGDGMRSAFYHVIIVADPSKLANQEIGTLADYISMLALTQVNSLYVCQQLPSIINLLAAGCADVPKAITQSDLGYLRGLYSMRADGNLRVQQDEIASRMTQTLGAK